MITVKTSHIYSLLFHLIILLFFSYIIDFKKKKMYKQIVNISLYTPSVLNKEKVEKNEHDNVKNNYSKPLIMEKNIKRDVKKKIIKNKIEIKKKIKKKE